MTLRNEITMMNNPQEFTRLIQALLSSEYKDDYQSVDDSQADNGNDGYIKSKKMVLARHCFVKTEKQHSRQDIADKAIGDFEKAIRKLKETGRLDFKKWAFISNYEVPEEVLSKLREKAQQLGFNEENIVIMGPVEIEVLCLKHKNILESFPELQFFSINEQFEKLNEKLDQIQVTISKPEELKRIKRETVRSEERLIAFTNKEQKSKDLIRAEKLAFKIMQKGCSKEDKEELRVIIYSSPDLSAQLQAIVNLTNCYHPLEVSPDEMIMLCDQGIALAIADNNTRVEAILISEKAQFISTKFSTLDSETAFTIKMGNSVGISLLTKDQIDGIIKTLRKWEAEIYTLFAMAMEKAQASKDYQAVGKILMNIANAAGLRFIHFNALQIEDRANEEKELCKRSYLEAKNVFYSLGDELSAAYALHNLANNLATFGEDVEAIKVSEKVIKIAKKYKIKQLERFANEVIVCVQDRRRRLRG